MKRELFERLFQGTTPYKARPGICSIDEDEELDEFGGDPADLDDSEIAQLNEDDEGDEPGDAVPTHKYKSHEEAEKGYRELQKMRLQDTQRYKDLESQVVALQQASQPVPQTPVTHEADWKKELSDQASTNIVANLSKIDQNSPSYQTDFYRVITEGMSEQIEKMAGRIADERVMGHQNKVTTQDQAEALARQCLVDEGLPADDEEVYQEVLKEKAYIMEYDQGFLRQHAPHEQIPALVRRVKDKLYKFRTVLTPEEAAKMEEEKALTQEQRHQARLEQRKSGAGIMGKGAKAPKAVADEAPSLGSTANDLKRLRKKQRRDTGKKLGQAANA